MGTGEQIVFSNDLPLALNETLSYWFAECVDTDDQQKM